jgi:hypothetical protein
VCSGVTHCPHCFPPWACPPPSPPHVQIALLENPHDSAESATEIVAFEARLRARSRGLPPDFVHRKLGLAWSTCAEPLRELIRLEKKSIGPSKYVHSLGMPSAECGTLPSVPLSSVLAACPHTPSQCCAVALAHCHVDPLSCSCTVICHAAVRLHWSAVVLSTAPCVSIARFTERSFITGHFKDLKLVNMGECPPSPFTMYLVPLHLVAADMGTGG